MRKRIGEFLVEKGAITRAQIPEILEYAQESGLRFGEAAMEIGLVSPDKMLQIFGPSYAVDFFHLDPAHFPESTRDLFSPEQMIRFGLLPLGLKRRRNWFRTRQTLNLGMLTPSREDARKFALETAMAKLGAPLGGVTPFLVLADQFVRILSEVYRIPEDKIRDLVSTSEIDPTLQLFLNS
jgi:hypothetical protein